MGGRRVALASASRPPSLWDVDLLRRELAHRRRLAPRGAAAYVWRYHRRSTTWADVNWGALKRRVPQKLPAFLEDAFSGFAAGVAQRLQRSSATTKVVVKLRDGAEVEAVVMRHATLRSTRVTCCVSSQVGCAMACSLKRARDGRPRRPEPRRDRGAGPHRAVAAAPSTRNVVLWACRGPADKRAVGACRLLLDSPYRALRAAASRCRRWASSSASGSWARTSRAWASRCRCTSVSDQAKREAIMPAARGHRIDRVLDAATRHVASGWPPHRQGAPDHGRVHPARRLQRLGRRRRGPRGPVGEPVRGPAHGEPDPLQPDAGPALRPADARTPARALRQAILDAAPGSSAACASRWAATSPAPAAAPQEARGAVDADARGGAARGAGGQGAVAAPRPTRRRRHRRRRARGGSGRAVWKSTSVGACVGRVPR